MTDGQIIIKAIEKAEKNGWKSPYLETSFQLTDMVWGAAAPAIVFRHEFAKAFFGQDYVCQVCGYALDDQKHCAKCKCYRWAGGFIEAWKYHLQKLVLQEEPPKYLEKFL